MPTSHARTLKKAAEILGSEEHLAAALEIGLRDLRAYIQGKRMSTEKFIEALDIVANAEPG